MGLSSTRGVTFKQMTKQSFHGFSPTHGPWGMQGYKKRGTLNGLSSKLLRAASRSADINRIE